MTLSPKLYKLQSEISHYFEPKPINKIKTLTSLTGPKFQNFLPIEKYFLIKNRARQAVEKATFTAIKNHVLSNKS